MILIDMNQVMISNLMVQVKLSDGIDKGLVRHMVLNSLRMYIQKFQEEYGKELVLCYDSKRYWRREFFPYYKGTRKKDREKSSFNWAQIFEVLNEIRDEIRHNMPYVVMEVDGAEADDIISVLTKHIAFKNIRLQKDMQPAEKVLILSGDKDFIQLQKYPWLKQYNPVMKKFVSGMSWENYGKWHIDHIKPCASFNLLEEDEQKKCFHYTNLQPLWAKDNLKKGGKYECVKTT